MPCCIMLDYHHNKFEILSTGYETPTFSQAHISQEEIFLSASPSNPATLKRGTVFHISPVHKLKGWKQNWVLVVLDILSASVGLEELIHINRNKRVGDVGLWEK